MIIISLVNIILTGLTKLVISKKICSDVILYITCSGPFSSMFGGDRSSPDGGSSIAPVSTVLLFGSTPLLIHKLWFVI